jgi:hypothetical protein
MTLKYLKPIPNNTRKQIDKLKLMARGLSNHFGGATVLVNYGPIGASCGDTRAEFNQWGAFESLEFELGVLHCLN